MTFVSQLLEIMLPANPPAQLHLREWAGREGEDFPEELPEEDWRKDLDAYDG